MLQTKNLVFTYAAFLQPFLWQLYLMTTSHSEIKQHIQTNNTAEPLLSKLTVTVKFCSDNRRFII